ncbi:MAG: GH1 family beta-glucosidase [Desulfosarcinaceae bacterium]|nr:GH1 family beta-glucosidase [Desulfosarcinaceae bacterium]
MRTFPTDFTWGAATSAYQIEGGSTADGKGPSIWDAFTTIPGKIHNAHSGRSACDHFHRYREDIALMRTMGLKAYRFSISWPRLLPRGRRAVNRAGIAFYDRLIDALLAEEITPWATLYHWDLPLALQMAQDGWLNPEMPTYFAEYADLCFSHFGDRVKHWITINEAWVVAILGHGHGIFAPGRTSHDEPYRVGHHLLLAHGAAAQLYRSKYQPRQRGVIGMANNCDWREPASEEGPDRAAAERALAFFLGWFGDPLYHGRYPEVMRSRLGDRLPRFTAAQAAQIKGSTDFFGLNHYTTMLAAHCDNPSSEGNYLTNIGIAEDQDLELHLDPEWPVTAIGWGIVPWGCHKLLHWIDARYDHPEIVLTENGCAVDDDLVAGRVDDQRRIDYFNGYVAACHQALADGIALKGYFAWSLLDNFEWALGYSMRFGIHYVDYATQERTPKASAKWYAAVIRQNGLP